MIGARERILAMVGCFSAGTLAVGAKAAGPALVIWTVVVIAYLALCRPNFRSIMSDLSKPSAPVVTLLVVAGYNACLSAVAQERRWLG